MAPKCKGSDTGNEDMPEGIHKGLPWSIILHHYKKKKNEYKVFWEQDNIHIFIIEFYYNFSILLLLISCCV
jgi:hypothetical protein